MTFSCAVCASGSAATRSAHDASHVHALDHFTLPSRAEKIGQVLAADLRRNKAIMGIFDEGCMGMYNAIIPDELLHRTGVFKERLSQSQLYAAMLQVSESEAQGSALLAGRQRASNFTPA